MKPLAAILLWLISASSGCCATRPGVPRPNPIRCLLRPPPTTSSTLKDLDPAGPGSRGCDSAFAVCMTPEEALEIGEALEDLRKYARDAWTMCGPVPGAVSDASSSSASAPGSRSDGAEGAAATSPPAPSHEGGSP